MAGDGEDGTMVKTALTLEVTGNSDEEVAAGLLVFLRHMTDLVGKAAENRPALHLVMVRLGRVENPLSDVARIDFGDRLPAGFKIAATLKTSDMKD